MSDGEDRDAQQPLLSTSGQALITLVEDSSQTTPITQRGTSLLQGIFNITNVFMGAGMLSMPYAMALSGWCGILVLIAAASLFCLSGRLLMAAFDKLPSHLHHTYPALGGACMMWVIMAQIVEGLLPPQGLLGLSPFHCAAMTVVAALTPLLLLPSFKQLSWLNAAGLCSTLLVMSSVASLALLDPHRQHLHQQPVPGHSVLRPGIISAAGIFSVSVSGHSSLPVLRNSMARPREFGLALSLAFACMAAIYGCVSGFGYWYFGNTASTLVTSDLARHSPFTGHSIVVPGLTVAQLVDYCILCNCYTTFPSLLLVMQDMLVSILPWSVNEGFRPPRRPVMYAIRFSIFALVSATGVAAFSDLGNLMSLVGGLASVSCSLLLPSAFYGLLHWKELGTWRRAGISGMLLVGVAMACLIAGQNAMGLWSKHVRHQDGAAQHMASPPPIPL